MRSVWIILTLAISVAPASAVERVTVRATSSLPGSVIEYIARVLNLLALKFARASFQSA